MAHAWAGTALFGRTELKSATSGAARASCRPRAPGEDTNEDAAIGCRLGVLVCAGRDGADGGELAKGSTNTSNVVNYGMGYDLRLSS
jgi:hypothetical protein